MASKITLLIVEDEIAIRDMLRFSLPEAEFELIDADNTSVAMKQLTMQAPDLILLDWMLPGKSGIAFIQWIKGQDHLANIPIIMLTARAEEENKIKALMIGADDYVTKPFSPNELIARIKVVLRRGTLVSPDSEIKYELITLNAAKHEVKIRNQILNLSPIEYSMLYFFMRHPDKTYTRDQLITRIWGNDIHISDRTVDVQIRRLRDKLKAHNCQHYIKTIRGTGYQFSKDES